MCLLWRHFFLALVCIVSHGSTFEALDESFVFGFGAFLSLVVAILRVSDAFIPVILFVALPLAALC
jgi:hypothetical protein